MSGVWKKVCIQKITFWFNLLRENDIFCLFGAFLRSIILNWKIRNASDFDLKVLQSVRFGIENKLFSNSYWTRHFFILKKYNTSDFQSKFFNHWETIWRLAASSCTSGDWNCNRHCRSIFFLKISCY